MSLSKSKPPKYQADLCLVRCWKEWKKAKRLVSWRGIPTDLREIPLMVGK